MQIKTILKGCIPEQIQTVGIMQVIPLTSAIVEEGLCVPKFTGTIDYGEMVFKNETENLAIIPMNAMFITKQKAQDHAMSNAYLLSRNGQEAIDNARCIEETQGGHIKEDSSNKLAILPASLRQYALQKRHSTQYGEIWDDIKRFNKKGGANSQRGHLCFFTKHHENVLNNFVAEFERIPGQIGAIVLIDGKVVGIERCPNEQYFADVWEALIRECYGSMAIIANQSLPSDHSPETIVKLNKNCNTLENLNKEFYQAKEKERELVRKTINDLIEDDFDLKAEQKIEDYDLITIENGQFTGQTVKNAQNVPIYASLSAKEGWKQSYQFNNAEEFSM